MKRIILASNSPRRRELLGGLDLDFEVKVLPDIDESYPDNLPAAEVAGYIFREKAAPYRTLIGEGDLVITADTVVIVGNEVLGKPKDAKDAHRMLQLISGRTHQVITGVCLLTTGKEHSFSVTTDVTFKQLSDDEIAYYIEHYMPFDKAGAYGIQGYGRVLVEKIDGDYYSIMGFPISNFLKNLRKIGYKISQIDKI